MKLSVIIVNFNVRPFLENALVTVKQAMSGIEGEMIVVDNGSDDGSVEMVRQKFPDVKLIALSENLGFAAANNRALSQAAGEYFLFLNPDTVIQEDTLRVMTGFLDNHADVGLAGCKILNPDGTLQLACRRSFPTPWVAFTKVTGLSALFPKSPLLSKYNLLYLDPNESYEVDAVSGSFMFVRRAVVESVGGLDEQFFMYGEDLDWCYRIKQAGWKIMYVHETQIIHYKGESARRSDIDEVRLFYQAMRVFVRKHFRRGIFSDVILPAGIALREWAAFLGRTARPLRAAALDAVLVSGSVLVGEYLWFGHFFYFPSYATPVTMTVPPLAIVFSLYSLGVYTKRKLSISRATASVVIGFIVLSALTFFFKQYGFSRMVVAISGIVSVVLLPGWRVLARAWGRSPERQRKSLFGRRTIIVGACRTGHEVLRKLRARIDDGYEVVGFVDVNRMRVGEKIAGVEILGSIDNIGKVIVEHRASEVIFSTDTLSYADILAVIGRSRNRSVNFRLIPSSLEVIIGKTHIDELDDIPLVDIDYNIDRPANRIGKRFFDIAVSLALLATAYPVVLLRGKTAMASRLGAKVLQLPRVLRGEMSIVGPPEYILKGIADASSRAPLFWGKPGITGLVQINYHDDLHPEEIEKYNLYYAKNQSILLDLEILLKSVIILLHR